MRAVFLAATCTSLVVTGDFEGNYTANGTYRGKLDFYSSDGANNLYFEWAARRRRALGSAPEMLETGDLAAHEEQHASGVRGEPGG